MSDAPLLAPADVLAFGPHPDDVEMCAGGFLLKMRKAGYRCAIVDLTRGEAATRGTPETRALEVAEASRLLGLVGRENLGLPDGGLEVTAEMTRPVVEAICWRFRTGSPWRDLPRDFPSWQTVWWRFDRWAKDGTWDRVLRELQGQAHAVAELEWTVSVDSTVARAHQHAAGARRSATGGRSESQDPAA